MTRSTVDRNLLSGDLWTDILSDIFGVRSSRSFVLVLFNRRSVHRRGREGGGGSFWTLWTIRRLKFVKIRFDSVSSIASTIKQSSFPLDTNFPLSLSYAFHSEAQRNRAINRFSLRS